MKKLFTILVLFTMILSMTAQTEKFYEWKNGICIERDIIELDSVTFSLPAKIHVAVDLGLPSGTLWAECNIGAESPEDYGDYFAWGEIEPKICYSWDTYKWCYGSYDTITKYCINSSLGIKDNKKSLESEDDAATANRGDAWCMPTYTQQQELRDECSWEWTTQNGVNGYKVIGPNGNSIFFPASGYWVGDKIYSVNSKGAYWSCSLDESASNKVYIIEFDENYYKRGLYGSREDGYPIRPVVR